MNLFNRAKQAGIVIATATTLTTGLGVTAAMADCVGRKFTPQQFAQIQTQWNQIKADDSSSRSAVLRAFSRLGGERIGRSKYGVNGAAQSCRSWAELRTERVMRNNPQEQGYVHLWLMACQGGKERHSNVNDCPNVMHITYDTSKASGVIGFAGFRETFNFRPSRPSAQAAPQVQTRSAGVSGTARGSFARTQRAQACPTTTVRNSSGYTGNCQVMRGWTLTPNN